MGVRIIVKCDKCGEDTHIREDIIKEVYSKEVIYCDYCGLKLLELVEDNWKRFEEIEEREEVEYIGLICEECGQRDEELAELTEKKLAETNKVRRYNMDGIEIVDDLTEIEEYMDLCEDCFEISFE